MIFLGLFQSVKYNGIVCYFGKSPSEVCHVLSFELHNWVQYNFLVEYLNSVFQTSNPFRKSLYLQAHMSKNCSNLATSATYVPKCSIC